MTISKETKQLLSISILFVIFYYLPLESSRFSNAIIEALYLAKWYAREHVLLCLVPAFFIAGGIAAFLNQASVMKYLGPGANKFLSYSVASVSGSILAVCSCTVLPLFAGIYRMGAGLGPATAFLYAGPAINVLAIVLTAQVLGVELGIARAVGAIIFSIVIGLMMHLFFKNDSEDAQAVKASLPEITVTRPLWQNSLFFASMIAILVFANWGSPGNEVSIWSTIYKLKWLLTSISGLLLGLILVFWFGLNWIKITLVSIFVAILAIIFSEYPTISFTAGFIGLAVITGTSQGENKEWYKQSFGFAMQILPLLFIGILIAGALLGRPDQEGLIPSGWISNSVGGNSFGANLFASVAGAFMYFATLTEIPILQGLIGAGMGKGPALSLLLAGPALSLPNMFVIRSVMGTKKTIVFVLLVIVMATICGMIYGRFF